MRKKRGSKRALKRGGGKPDNSTPRREKRARSDMRSEAFPSVACLRVKSSERGVQQWGKQRLDFYQTKGKGKGKMREMQARRPPRHCASTSEAEGPLLVVPVEHLLCLIDNLRFFFLRLTLTLPPSPSLLNETGVNQTFLIKGCLGNTHHQPWPHHHRQRLQRTNLVNLPPPPLPVPPGNTPANPPPSPSASSPVVSPNKNVGC